MLRRLQGRQIVGISPCSDRTTRLPRAVLATTSGGNPLCNSIERFYRTDTPTARDFLTSQGIAVP